MKFDCLIRLIVIICITAVTTRQAFACKCASAFRGENSWELAKQETQGSIAIFEGAPERFELQWSLLNAKEGEWIPTAESADESPRMLVTFQVQRGYKGDLGPKIQIKTGLGGGDCGALFAPGLTYVVFAGGSIPNDLHVSMCSPGGWIGGSRSAVELRYLRKEHPIASDLVLIKRWTDKDYAAQEQQRRREFEEDRKRYEMTAGKICGTVVADKTKDGNTGILSFLSTAGYSPVDHPTATVDSDGSFCSPPLGPGKYYLHFTRISGETLTSAIYYPGVAERSKAIAVEIAAGQTQPRIVLTVPTQKTYSVRGLISTNDKSGLTANNVHISLVNLDRPSIYTRYDQSIDFQGFFPLPKTKYFNFEKVLPGHYVAYVSLFRKGWFAKKVELSVSTHAKFISLQLAHRQ